MVTHIKTIIDRVTAWADLTTKTSKTNGFDIIEIDLVKVEFGLCTVAIFLQLLFMFMEKELSFMCSLLHVSENILSREFFHVTEYAFLHHC